jgi:hypothetical protein
MEEKMLSATKVIQQINVSARTLDGWYKYVQDETLEKPENMPKLPEYVQSRPRGPRYWKESDIPALLAFKDWIPKGRNGVMGRINERFWGERYRKNDKEGATTNE